MSVRRMVRLLVHLVKMNAMLTMEYRVGFLMVMANGVVIPTIALLVWLAVAEHGVALPYDHDQFVTYYVVMSMVGLATQTWAYEYVAEEIRYGDLSKWLLRPAPNILHYVGNNLGEKVIKVWLLIPFWLVLVAIFRQSIRLPAEPARWGLFLAALIMAGILMFLMDYLMGSLAFWLQDVTGVVAVERLLYGLLAGRLVPLAMFPNWLSGLLEAQPWRYVLSFPLEVLVGALDAPALARGFAWQVAYCLGSYLTYRLVWRYGLRAYAATGA